MYVCMCVCTCGHFVQVESTPFDPALSADRSETTPTPGTKGATTKRLTVRQPMLPNSVNQMQELLTMFHKVACPSPVLVVVTPCDIWTVCIRVRSLQ
jgi:hypothetical protein